MLGKSHAQRSLAGYSPWGHKELNTTECLTHMYFPVVITFLTFLMLRSYKLNCVNLFFKITGIPFTAKAKFITLQV